MPTALRGHGSAFMPTQSRGHGTLGGRGNVFDSRRTRTVRRDRPAAGPGDRRRTEPVGQLAAVQALRLDELVARPEMAVADELAPAADRPVLGGRRVAAGDDRGGA